MDELDEMIQLTVERINGWVDALKKDVAKWDMPPCPPVTPRVSQETHWNPTLGWIRG